MNYNNHYNNLIKSRLIERSFRWNIHKCRKLAQSEEKCELQLYIKHHIIPRCIGGTDDVENIILLTPVGSENREKQWNHI